MGSCSLVPSERDKSTLPPPAHKKSPLMVHAVIVLILTCSVLRESIMSSIASELSVLTLNQRIWHQVHIIYNMFTDASLIIVDLRVFRSWCARCVSVRIPDAKFSPQSMQCC